MDRPQRWQGTQHLRLENGGGGGDTSQGCEEEQVW